MLTNKAIFEETEAANKVISESKDKVNASILKMLTMILKVLSSIRTNQVLTMAKMGVQKIEPQRRKDENVSPTTK